MPNPTPRQPYSENILPNYVFSRKYNTHLFFDEDVTSSIDLLSDVKKLILQGDNELMECEIRPFSKKEAVTRLKLSEDLPEQIAKIGKQMRSSGDPWGLIISDPNGLWAIHQRSPVEIGVIGFDFFLREKIGGHLFGCGELGIFLEQKITEKDLPFSSAFLRDLQKNYCP